jgi:hypothetical protein
VFSKPDFLITVKVITHAEPHKVDERVKGNTGPNKLQTDTFWTLAGTDIPVFDQGLIIKQGCN